MGKFPKLIFLFNLFLQTQSLLFIRSDEGDDFIIQLNINIYKGFRHAFLITL